MYWWFIGMCGDPAGLDFVMVLDADATASPESFELLKVFGETMVTNNIPDTTSSSFGLVTFADVATTVLTLDESPAHDVWIQAIQGTILFYLLPFFL